MFVTLSVWLKYIKNNNRASNEPYNLFEFLKFPFEDSSLSIHFFQVFWGEML